MLSTDASTYGPKRRGRDAEPGQGENNKDGIEWLHGWASGATQTSVFKTGRAFSTMAWLLSWQNDRPAGQQIAPGLRCGCIHGRKSARRKISPHPKTIKTPPHPPHLSYLFQEADRADELRQYVARFGKELRRVAEALGQERSITNCQPAVLVRRRRENRKKGEGVMRRDLGNYVDRAHRLIRARGMERGK